MPIIDADQREMYISVGCALENLLLATRAFRFDCQVTYFPDPDHPNWVANVDLRVNPSLHDEQSLDLFSAVLSRRTYHYGYRPQAIDEDMQARIQKWAL
uniref:Uncharacterized protein n=1 Tax=Roseihalotalea indica TaxID=2867963 RepID=A0AA49GII0_9BACT|nr:hypothetical protein K4G66_19630 [Tunicatimonas sp. TK19036]